jgi:hypothetical protein
VEISQSTARGAGKSGELPVEGRVESVKDGVAQVRVSRTQVVTAVLEGGAAGGMPAVGSKVALFQNADGSVVAKSVATAAVDAKDLALRLLMESLSELVGEAVSPSLAKALASGDLEGARKHVAQIWKEVQGQPPEQVAPKLRAWLEKQAPMLLSRAGEAPVLTGSVALSLGAPGANQGEYLAVVAGQSAKVLGPSGLEPGPKGIWQTRPVPGGGAMWAPMVSETVRRPDATLPQRVAADAQGAAQLLEWAGVDSTPEAMASLGAFLEKVARVFQGDTGRAANVAGAMPPGAVEAGTAANAPTGSVGSAAARQGEPVPHPATKPEAAMDLPRPVAQRALVAWASALPDEALVRQAVVAGGSALPEALANLAIPLAARPGGHPALEAALREWERGDWSPPAGMKSAGQGAPLRERLAEAVMEALAGTEPSKEQAGLRQGLQQVASALIQESLEPPRDAARQEPPAVFHARDAQGRMDEGRIVVHDRRSRKRESEGASDHHAVDIEMKPAALGPIKAHLELRGKTLTTRLEAKESETSRLIEERVGELREAFQRIGLEPARIEVQRPKSAEGIDPRKRGSGTNLDLRV